MGKTAPFWVMQRNRLTLSLLIPLRVGSPGVIFSIYGEAVLHCPDFLRALGGRTRRQSVPRRHGRVKNPGRRPVPRGMGAPAHVQRLRNDLHKAAAPAGRGVTV